MRKSVLTLLLLLIADLVFAQGNKRKEITGVGVYLVGSGESQDAGIQKATEKAKLNALDQFGVFIDMEQILHTQKGEKASTQVFEENVRTIAGAVIKMVPNSKIENIKYSQTERFSPLEVKVTARFVFDKGSFDRNVAAYIKAREENRDLDDLVGKIESLNERISTGISGGDLSKNELKTAQKSVSSLQRSLNKKLNHFSGGDLLANIEKREAYVRNEIEDISYYLDLLFSDPSFRYEFVTSGIMVKYESNKEVRLFIDWSKRINTYNKILFDDLGQRLHELVKENDDMLELILPGLRRVAKKNDHISFNENLYLPGQTSRSILNGFFKFVPRFCNVSVALGNRNGNPIGSKNFILTYVIEDGLFDADITSLSGEYNQKGKVEMSVPRTLLASTESILFKQDYQPSIGLAGTKIEITRRQKTIRKRNFVRVKPKFDFNFLTAIARPVRTETYHGRRCRLRFDYGPTEYYSERRNNSYLSSYQQETSSGESITIDEYTLGAKTRIRGNFFNYGISLAIVGRKGAKTHSVSEFKFSYLGPQIKEMIELQPLDGIWLATYGLYFESPLIVKGLFGLSYGASIGFFNGPEFRDGGLLVQPKVGLGLNLSNWLGFRGNVSYAVPKGLTSKGWSKSDGATMEINTDRGSQTRQSNLIGGWMVQVGVVINFGKANSPW